MKFTELEQLMFTNGIKTLADIARVLDTTPQAVSNWKARDQVPYRVVNEIQNKFSFNDNSVDMPPSDNTKMKKFINFTNNNNDTHSYFDLLLIIVNQIKVIFIVPIIIVFFTFLDIQFNSEKIYSSSATVMLSGNKENQNITAVSGFASQFGINMPQANQADITSTEIFPELINSRLFSERILDKYFFTSKYGKKLTLLSILTHGDEPSNAEREVNVKNAMKTLSGMITWLDEGSFNIIKVRSNEPLLSKQINEEVLNELVKLNKYFKNQLGTEKVDFINQRIKTIEDNLDKSELDYKNFLENNRQVSSPALQLEQDRITRNLDIEKGLYLTLKQQLELAKIEQIQQSTVIQILDYPQLPLSYDRINKSRALLLSGLFGIGLGIFIAFIRDSFQNAGLDERKKIRRIKNMLKKKIISIFNDPRIVGIIFIVLIIGVPSFLGYTSENPQIFGLYTKKVFAINILYLILLFSSGLFCFLLYRKNKKL